MTVSTPVQIPREGDGQTALVSSRLWSFGPDTPEGRDTLERIAKYRQERTERLERRANLLALLLPAALLAGAWGFQLIGGLTPCEMCHWQRWPHYAAVAVAALAFVAPGRARIGLVALAALLIATSGAIGVLHAGVEYHWWRGFTACTATTTITGANPAERLASLLAQPVVRCDVPQWTLGGVSMAGFNALLSLGGAVTILAMLRRAR